MKTGQTLDWEEDRVRGVGAWLPVRRPAGPHLQPWPHSADGTLAHGVKLLGVLVLAPPPIVRLGWADVNGAAPARRSDG